MSDTEPAADLSAELLTLLSIRQLSAIPVSLNDLCNSVLTHYPDALPVSTLARKIWSVLSVHADIDTSDPARIVTTLSEWPPGEAGAWVMPSAATRNTTDTTDATGNTDATSDTDTTSTTSTTSGAPQWDRAPASKALPGALVDCDKPMTAWLWFLNGPGQGQWHRAARIARHLSEQSDCAFSHAQIKGVPMGLHTHKHKAASGQYIKRKRTNGQAEYTGALGASVPASTRPPAPPIPPPERPTEVESPVDYVDVRLHRLTRVQRIADETPPEQLTPHQRKIVDAIQVERDKQEQAKPVDTTPTAPQPPDGPVDIDPDTPPRYTPGENTQHHLNRLANWYAQRAIDQRWTDEQLSAYLHIELNKLTQATSEPWTDHHAALLANTLGTKSENPSTE